MPNLSARQKLIKEKQQQLAEKQIAKYEKDCEGKDTYNHYKKLDYWTLDQGLKLLIHPIEIGQRSSGIPILLFDVEFLKDFKKFQIITTSINRSLPVEGDYEKKILEYQKSDIDKSNSNLWYYCYVGLRVNPFKFLDFIREKKLFKIPPELEFIKTKTDSGEVQYSWASENMIEQANGQSKTDPSVKTEMLNGKDRQELGRLRAEKEKMDSTVKAAIEVGQFVQQKIDKGETIIRKEISDLVYKIDKKIPDTRIDLIWRSLPTAVKKGPGRRKKK